VSRRHVITTECVLRQTGDPRRHHSAQVSQPVRDIERAGLVNGLIPVASLIAVAVSGTGTVTGARLVGAGARGEVVQLGMRWAIAGRAGGG
jgi:hypothetical protein